MITYVRRYEDTKLFPRTTFLHSDIHNREKGKGTLWCSLNTHPTEWEPSSPYKCFPKRMCPPNWSHSTRVGSTNNLVLDRCSYHALELIRAWQAIRGTTSTYWSQRGDSFQALDLRCGGMWVSAQFLVKHKPVTVDTAQECHSSHSWNIVNCN